MLSKLTELYNCLKDKYKDLDISWQEVEVLDEDELNDKDYNLYVQYQYNILRILYKSFVMQKLNDRLPDEYKLDEDFTESNPYIGCKDYSFQDSVDIDGDFYLDDGFHFKIGQVLGKPFYLSIFPEIRYLRHSGYYLVSFRNSYVSGDHHLNAWLECEFLETWFSLNEDLIWA